MNDVDIFLNAVKEANGNNPIINTLTTDGVVFIDYKDIGDLTIDGIKVNSCIRLKTLPTSGFVGSRKIFYTRIDLSKLYPFIGDIVVLVSDHADIRELLKELGEQSGIIIDPEILINNLDNKLLFDDRMCGSITLKTNPRSIFIQGEVIVKYTCNKYRVLNYVKNRVISLSETALLDRDVNSYYTVLPSFYYCDAANFPPDHDIFVKYDCLAGVNHLNDQVIMKYVDGVYKPINYKTRIFDAGNMPTYFRSILEYCKGDMRLVKTLWENHDIYNFRQVVHAFLKWYGQDTELAKYSESKPNDKGVYINAGDGTNTLDKLDFYFIGKTVDLVTTIKNDPIYAITVGNCGVNINFTYVCAFRTNSNLRFYDRHISTNMIIPIYWG